MLQLVEGKTTALGLLLYGKYARSHQGWAPVEELIGTQAINPKAMSKANHHILHQFRRLLLEHGGMQHAPSSVPLSVPEWLTRLHDNALQAIPTRFLPEPVSFFSFRFGRFALGTVLTIA